MRAESCGNAPSSRKPQTRAKKRLAFRFCANRKFFKCVDNKPIDDGLIKRVPIKATLVVMPSLLIQQWTTELARHAPCLKVLVYEGAEATGGSGKGVCAKDLAEQDVVLMNFETLQSGAKP